MEQPNIFVSYLRVTQHMSQQFRSHFGRLDLTFPQALVLSVLGEEGPVPISALAYELIRYAARMPDGFWATLLRAPGLALQRLTTYEPDEAQLDVAVVALREALGPDAGDNIRTAPYTEA